MEEDTESDYGDEGLDQFWKRRAIALAGVIGTIGFMVYACSGDDDGKRTVQNAAAVGTPSASASSAAPAVMPTVTVTATATTTAKPRKKDGDACDPKAMVLSLAPVKDVYRDGEQPQFRMTLVNTGERACTFDVGRDSVDLRVSSGTDRVWSARQCARDGSSIQLLRRGIPYTETITWDRRRGNDGCRGHREEAQPGTYVAKIKARGLKAPRQVFALR
ncbi:hypothetical protein [Actinomadura macrotermitis]|nr:hypothetical protein [Actinomadura macrotermitis]